MSNNYQPDSNMTFQEKPQEYRLFYCKRCKRTIKTNTWYNGMPKVAYCATCERWAAEVRK